MGFIKRTSFVLSGLILLSAVYSVQAESKDDYKNRPLDVRVEHLERLMSSQKQLDFLYRLKQLQKENQELRSLLEEQANEIRQLKQQQRQLYQDMDRRLGQGAGVSQVPLSRTEPAGQEKTSPPVEVVEKSTVKPSNYEQTRQLSSKPVSASGSQKPQAAVRQLKERQAEQKAYQEAYDELRAHRYNAAREAFSQFIEQYPHGRYAHIAQYWIAESSYAQRDYEQAIADYQRLLDVYPFGPKKVEAELKKAYSYYELGKKDQTRKTLEQLLRQYPDTTEAGQARRLLKKL